MNVRQQRIKGVFLLRELAFFFTARTRSFYDWFTFKRVPWQKLLIDNNGSTRQLSTIICDTMGPTHITMSSVDLLHELNVFTTRVKTKIVPLLGHSTSNVIVQHKSLRRNLIPCQLLSLIFLFFCFTCSQFFYCTNSIENQNKKDKYSRNSCGVNMVWEDMESLPIIDIIGKLVQNSLQPEHNFCKNRNFNSQDAHHYHYVMA